MTDPIDEFWVPAINTYKEKPFKSATRGGVDLDKISPPEEREENTPEAPAKLASLIAIFKLALGDAVKDVRSSERLTDSAVCLVADEGDMDMHLERLLKQHRQLDTASKRILELNPRHKLIERLAATVGDTGASDQLVGIRLAAVGSGTDRRRRAASRPAGLRPPPRHPARARAAAGGLSYSGKGAAAPSGTATWKTFSVFPINV